MTCPKCIGALPAAGMSRRAVLDRFGMGLGGIALANLVNPVARLRVHLADTRHRIAECSVVSFTCRQRRSASSISSWPAGRRRWRRSTTSRVLNQRNGEQLPDSVRQGQRLTGMSGNQASLPARRDRSSSSASTAQNGTWVSDLLPHTAKIVDDLCIVRSMYTEAINHDPAITFFQTGSQIAGPAEHGRVGALRARQRQRESAGVRRADHARARSISRSTRGCGAAASCRRSIRECSSGAARTRCCIWRIPTA